MKAVVLDPWWAALVALGFKTVETGRPGPPAGSMRPPGVRQAPGYGLEPGERFAVVAGRRSVRRGGEHALSCAGVLPPSGAGWTVENDGGGLLLRGPISWPFRLPRGAALCVSSVAAAFPVDQVEFTTLLDQGDEPWRIIDEKLYVRASEEPLSRLEHGSWIWALHPAKRLPVIVPVAGKQGIFKLPDGPADRIEGELCGVTTRTIWQACRTDSNLAPVMARVPEWAVPWVESIAVQLTASFQRMRDEVCACAEFTVGDVPGPYREHVADLRSGEVDRMEQRLWARLRPAESGPRRL